MSDQARASTGAFGDDPKLAPRYMNIPTFMRTPLLRSADEADIVMIGVPYDHAVTNRPGARHGPREVRNASTMMRSVHHVSGINPHALLRIGDLGDVPLPHLFDDAGVVGDIEGFYQDVAAAGAMPLSIGGDHSITFPILKALGRERPLGLVHIDAHTDTWDQFLNTRFSHGAPFRRAVETGVLDPKRTIQIGIRGAQNADEGWRYSRESGMRVVFIEELNARGVDTILEEARALVGTDPAYVTFDIDSLDPAFAPGTGTPEFGGLTPIQAQALVRGLDGLNLVGADVVEVSPPFDHAGITALAGATMAYELLCILAKARSERQS
jgi:guanidinopropionase